MATSPTVAHLDALLARHTRAEARLTVAGDPRSLPATLELPAYRIVEPAQALTQTRPGARGALLLSAGDVSPAEFGQPWPAGVPLQIHTAEPDSWTDVDVARQVAAQIDGAELFGYPGSAHLFADPSLAGYDEAAAGLLLERLLAFLERLG